MTSPKNNDVIQAFASGTANESFANRILQGGTNCCSQDFHACAFCGAIESSPKLVVIVANNVSGSFTKGRDIPKLLFDRKC